MTLTAVSVPGTINKAPRESRRTYRATGKGPGGESTFVELQIQMCDLRDTAVQNNPPELVSRQSTCKRGLGTDSICALAGSRVEFRFQAPVNLLVMYDEGARREGETFVEGINSSTLRDFAGKLTFVPAGNAYHEWHEISIPARFTFFYLEPAELHNFGDAAAIPYRPEIFFEDAVLRKTATKLKEAIERSEVSITPYLEALAGVLLHELPQYGQRPSPNSPLNHCNLAPWETHTVTSYVEEHVEEYRNREVPHLDVQLRFASLTPRQRQVMALVTSGLMNKQTAAVIGISEMTVKIHRGHVMRKMGARSLAELVIMAESLGVRGRA